MRGLRARAGEDVGEQRRRGRLAEGDRLRAAAGLEVDVAAVAVGVLALAGEADERVGELAVVRLAGLNWSSTTTSPAGSRVSVAHWASAVAPAGTASARRRRSGRCRARSGTGPGPGRAARPGRAACASGAIHGNPAVSVAAVSLTPGRMARANSRVGGQRRVDLGQRDVGGLERRAELADRGLQVVAARRRRRPSWWRSR